MNKTVSMSLVSILAISSLYADDVQDMFSEGKVSGQIRMYYVDREYQGSLGNDTHRDSSTLGGHIKYETAELKGLSLAAAFYTTNKMGLNQHDVQDPALLGTGLNSYSILGEAYINYNFSEFGSKSNLKLGLQRYDVPMMGSDDARTLPNTFEVYKFTNKDIENLNFQLAHVNQIAYGAFSNIYSGGILAATSGYPALGNAGTGTYHNLGEASVGKYTSGVTNAIIGYKSKNFNSKIANDYAWDLYNTLYADVNLNMKEMISPDFYPFFAAQVIKQNSVGGQYMQNLAISDNGEIDSFYYGLKLGATYTGLTMYVAYSQTTKNDATEAANNPFKNAIVSQFGGMPAYTQGMVTRHQFLAGTKASKAAATYSFKQQGVNLSTTAYYTSFNMDENSGYGVTRTAYEPGFDIKYYPEAVKNLQLRFRGNFPRKFAEPTAGALGWDEYRLIANYNF